MKQFFLLVSVILLLQINGQSQTPTTSLPFEINVAGNDKIFCCVEFGRQVKFKVANVNTIHLNGYTLAKAVDANFASPAFFQDTQMPSLESIANASQAKTEQTKATKEEFLTQTFTFQNNIKTLKSRASGIQNKPLQDSLKKQEAAIDSLQKKIAQLQVQIDAETAKKDFVDKYKTLVYNFQKLQLYIAAENQLDSMLPPVIIRNVMVLKQNAENYILAIYGSTDPAVCVQRISTTINSINESYAAMKKDYENINTPRIDSTSLSGDLKSEDGSTILSVSDAAMKIKRKPLFESEYKYAEKIIAQINDAKNAVDIFNKAKAGVNLYNLISKEDFVAYTDAQQVMSDTVILTPSLKDKNDKVIQTFNPVTVTTKGGLKVNFTTGYLLSFIGDDNYNYFTEGGVVKGIVKQQKNAVTHAIGALAHVYERTCSGMNIAGTGGFSLTADGNIGFYLGASILCLEKNRLALSAGMSFVKIKRLDTGNLTEVNGSQKYNFLAPSSDVKINYNALYKPSVFIGITYNIFTGK